MVRFLSSRLGHCPNGIKEGIDYFDMFAPKLWKFYNISNPNLAPNNYDLSIYLSFHCFVGFAKKIKKLWKNAGNVEIKNFGCFHLTWPNRTPQPTLFYDLKKGGKKEKRKTKINLANPLPFRLTRLNPPFPCLLLQLPTSSTQHHQHHHRAHTTIYTGINAIDTSVLTIIHALIPHTIRAIFTIQLSAYQTIESRAEADLRGFKMRVNWGQAKFLGFLGLVNINFRFLGVEIRVLFWFSLVFISI